MPQYEVKNPYHSQGLAAGGSALLDAINKAKVHLAKFILDAGEQDIVNTRDFKGKTPLIRACYIKEEKTRAKAIDLLLQKNANVNIQDDSGRTALSYACELRSNDVVRIFVQNNVDPDIADIIGNTPLIHAAMAGNDTGIEILIRSFRRLGLNVDHVNNEGMTSLLIAAKYGYIECASILAIEGRACISFRDRERGMNAEEWARAQGCTTPEVMPFSTQASLWNIKYKDGEQLRSPGEEMGLTKLELEKLNARRRSRSREGRKHSRGGTEINMEDLNRRMSQVTAKLSPDGKMSGKSECGARSRKKRGSLPTIKFHTTTVYQTDNIDDPRLNPSLPKLVCPKDNGDRKEYAARDRSGTRSPERQKCDNLRSRSRSPENDLPIQDETAETDYLPELRVTNSVRSQNATASCAKQRNNAEQGECIDDSGERSQSQEGESGTKKATGCRAKSPNADGNLSPANGKAGTRSRRSTNSTLASASKIDVDFDSEEQLANSKIQV